MLDFESQIENVYSTMVKQFAYIVFYFNLNTSAALLAFTSNLVVLLYMVKCYSA